MERKAGAAGAVAVIPKSPTKSAVVDLPISRIEGFPAATVEERIGAGEIIDERSGQGSGPGSLLERMGRNGGSSSTGGGGLDEMAAFHGLKRIGLESGGI